MGLWVRTLLVTAAPAELEAARAGHVEHLRRLHADGRLRAAGELGDGDGFLEIFEAKDRLEAEAIARSSPLVEEGLGTWMLREWAEVRF
jgi:uncharacterized protein YciI